MKSRVKILTSITSIMLSVTLLITFVLFGNRAEASDAPVALTRTMELSVVPEYEKYLNDFEEKNITYNDDCVGFYGIRGYDEQILSMFDMVALSDDANTEQSNIVYDCAFDMETMQFTFRATLLDENGDIVDEDETVTDAFVTESGRLDAYIEIDGEIYLLSDYVSTDAIDNCLFGWIKAIVTIVVVIVVYVVVAETAEQIKAKQNYEYNQNLDDTDNGVAKGTYVTGQDVTDMKKNSPGNYRFGFTSFGKVGCEVASAYNAMIALNKAEGLSETIYSFEKWALEIAIGWGSLGSNPLQISSYLKRRGVSYTKITNYSSFKSAVAKKDNCHIIMSRWNEPFNFVLHTFYVYKEANNVFYGYNWISETSKPKPHDNIDAFNDGSGFIVGYIVWSK